MPAPTLGCAFLPCKIPVLPPFLWECSRYDGGLASTMDQVLNVSCKICVLAGGMVWNGEGRRGAKENERGFV